MSKKNLIITTSSLFFWIFTAQVCVALSYGDAGNSLSKVAPLTGVSNVDLPTASGQIVKSILSVLGLIFFVLMVYSGITWMTAKGDEDAVNKARDTIFGAVIGLTVILASYAVTSYVMDRVVTGTSEPGTVGQNGGTIGGEELGCCTDWSAGGDFEAYGTAGYRITSIGDCQQQGEAKESDGYSCTGPQVGCWTFQAGIIDANQCQATGQN